MSERKRQQAWESGNEAARAGMDRDACKQQRGTIYFDDWQDGFSVGLRAATNPEAPRKEGE